MRIKGKRLFVLVMCLGLLCSVTAVSEPVLAEEETAQTAEKTTVTAPGQDTLTVACGTAKEAIKFPALESEDKETVEDVVWECGDYDKTKPGDYIFTAKLKDGYITRDDEPITVTVSVRESAAASGDLDAETAGKTAEEDSGPAAPEQVSAAAPANITYKTSGTWGQCVWKVEGDTLTVEPGTAGNVAGNVYSAPWSSDEFDEQNPSEPNDLADMQTVRKIVITGKSRPDGLYSLFENYIPQPGSVELDYVRNQPLHSLESIDLSGFDTSDATDMAYMFNELRNLKAVNLTGKFNTAKVTDMQYLFDVCQSLESVDLSNFNTANVKNFSLFFGKCFELRTIIPPNGGFDTRNAEKLDRMFENCSGYSDIQGLISAPNFVTSKAKTFNGMFKECNRNITRLDLSHFDFSNAITMEAMFSADYDLQEIIFPDKMETSNVTDFKEMFMDCTSLTSLDLSAFELDSVGDGQTPGNPEANSMYAMFKGCTGLVSLDLSCESWPTRNDFLRTDMFAGCDALAAVRLKDGFMFEGGNSNGFLPGNAAKPISKTGLKASGKWIGPDGTATAPENIDIAVQGDGWYLLQPAGGAYAYFYAPDASAAEPVFAASVNGRGTVPDVRSNNIRS